MKSIRFEMVLLAALFIAAASCTIDARTRTEEDGATDGGGAPPPPTEGEFEVAYTAPANASAVTFCSNFSGSWSCGTAISARTIRWTGDLDLRRLDLQACTAHAVGQDCGYVWNVSFDVPPFWAATRVGVVGAPDVSGPESVEVAWVENGLDGANLHLRRVR